MADVSVKMGVSGISQFKTAFNQAQQSVKTLDAELKKNEAAYKATGDKEKYMADQSDALKKKLDQQKAAVKAAEDALKEMDKQGVSPLNTQYQKMQQNLANAQAGMYNTQNAINSLGTSAGSAATQADKLQSSINAINKNVSLDTVLSGINGISSAMEKAGKKAVEVGKQIWSNIMDSAEYADNIATLATRTGLSIDEIQRMEYVADRFEAPVEQMAKTWKKVKMNMTSDSAEVQAAFEKVGVATTEMVDTGFGKVQQTKMLYSNYQDVFWKTGEAIMKVRNAAEQERLAQTLLGRSWDELIPLFTAGRAAYEEAMEGATVADEETVQNAADLNDRINELEKQWKATKLQVIGELAPVLKTAADAIGNLLGKITDYLKTDEGQKQLERIADAVGKIFGNLSEINPDDVVSKFAGVMEKIQEAFTWIGDHWTDVETGLKAIGIAFGTIKIASFATNLAKVVNGFKTLWNGAHKDLPQIPGTDSGAPAGTGAAAAGKAGLFSKASAAFAEAAGISLGGALAGAGITAGIIVLGTSAVRNINEQAAKEREVEADAHRFSYIGGPMGDKQLIMQDTIRRILATTGDGRGLNSPEYQLKWMGYNLNNQLMDAFNYKNKSGESRNKLVDMLGMDDQNAAVAAMIMHAAGFETNDSRLSSAVQNMYAGAWGKYREMTRPGSGGPELGYSTALTTMTDFLTKSGMFDENGTFWIPELYEKNQQEQADAAKAVTDAAESMATLPDKVAAAVSSAPIKVELGFGFAPKANGIWSVPFDGMMAMLHKGERVVPAREIASRNYSSNLYVESMYMNNGTDAAGLAAAMAAAQRRTMSGYGS